MQTLKVDELIPHPKNDFFFDDMDGEKWAEFLESVKTSGVIEPVIITTDKVIVSGHQRVRACKELGIKEVMCDIKNYNSDDEVTKQLLETNIRQRGTIGGSTVKLGRRIKELERLYGIRNGGDRRSEDAKIRSHNVTSDSEKDLVKQLGISMTTLKYAKTLASLPPEIQDLVENESIKPSTASRLIAKLSPSEQEQLISMLPAAKKMTQREVQGYIDKLREKDNQIEGYKKLNEELKSKSKVADDLSQTVNKLSQELANRPQIEKRIEVIPDDYEQTKKELSASKADYRYLQKAYENKIKENDELKNRMKKEKENEPQEEYRKKLKDNTIFFCGRVADFIEKVGGYVWLTEHINELPEYEKKSFISAINAVYGWSQTMLNNISAENGTGITTL